MGMCPPPHSHHRPSCGHSELSHFFSTTYRRTLTYHLSHLLYCCTLVSNEREEEWLILTLLAPELRHPYWRRETRTQHQEAHENREPQAVSPHDECRGCVWERVLLRQPWQLRDWLVMRTRSVWQWFSSLKLLVAHAKHVPWFTAQACCPHIELYWLSLHQQFIILSCY